MPSVLAFQVSDCFLQKDPQKTVDEIRAAHPKVRGCLFILFRQASNCRAQSVDPVFRPIPMVLHSYRNLKHQNRHCARGYPGLLSTLRLDCMAICRSYTLGRGFSLCANRTACT